MIINKKIILVIINLLFYLSLNCVETRVYEFTYNNEAGCSYTAQWMAEVNLFRRIPFWMDISRAEAASFEIFHKSRLKYLLTDPSAYYVHHMSMYEHLNHKKYGFDVAANKTHTMSNAAFQGECSSFLQSTSTDGNNSYIAMIPFYGGLPPNVTSNLTVQSQGQGNSLVNASTKSLQCFATVCSCLKYFGNVIIGVTNIDDRKVIQQQLKEFPSQAQQRIHIVQFEVERPIILIFHLLVWIQHYVKIHNCLRFHMQNSQQIKYPPKRNSDSSAQKGTRKLSWKKKPVVKYYFNNSILNIDPKDLYTKPKYTPYDICFLKFNSIQNSVHAADGKPPNVTYISWMEYLDQTKQNVSLEHISNNRVDYGLGFDMNFMLRQTYHPTIGNAKIAPLHSTPIQYIYYTESDQILRFDSKETFDAISAASNETTYFLGKRKEKSTNSDPIKYMSGLIKYRRDCGIEGYNMSWPTDKYIYRYK
eukprot:gene6295-8669_t